MQPKYAVNEVVLLRSQMFPECDGEYTVLGVHDSKEYGFGYQLDIKHEAEGYSDLWGEPSLRKKHTPGDMDFEDLMVSLSSPVLLSPPSQ